MQSFFEVSLPNYWKRVELTSPAVATAQTAKTLLVGLNMYLTMGRTYYSLTDVKKYRENIKTAEEIEAIPSLIQTSRFIWPQMATDANLE